MARVVVQHAGSWIPRTKLVAPQPGPAVVLEPALLDTLRGATVTAPLTLVTAQAGSGKTTLAAALVGSRPPMTSAWIGLDRGDDDLATLLHLLAIALDPLLLGGCAALQDLLRAGLPGAGDARRGAGVLVNDVLAAEPDPILLVLDDLHVLSDPDALLALDYLLDHLPAALRILATARTDPPLSLARRRVRGELVHVRAEQLRCSPDLATLLLNERLDLRLTRTQIEDTVRACDGWITGVRLLGESVARGADPGRTDAPDLFDYLADEVLDAVPEHVQGFLLDTCVLDVLTPAACRAVSLRDDSAALLDRLCRTHGFLVQVDERVPGGFRYQMLFAEFLRRRLEAEPARAAKLHLRAAAVAEPAGRIEHLLAAGAHDEAATTLEVLARATLRPSVESRRLAGWIARLDPHERDRPRLAAVAGMDAVAHGDLRRGEALLGSALTRFQDTGDIAGQWLAARHLHLATNDHQRFGPVLARLEAAPEFRQLPACAQVEQHIGRGYGALHTGAWDEAGRRFCAALDLTTTSGDVAAIEVLAQHIGPLPALCDDTIGRIEAYAAWVRGHVRDPSPLVRLGADHHAAVTAFLRGRLDEAEVAARHAGDLPERLGGMPFVRSALDWVQAGATFARGDLAGTCALLDARDAGVGTDLDRMLRTIQLGLRARVLRLQRRTPELTALVQEVSALAPTGRYAAQLRLLGVSVGAQAAWAGGDLDTAVEMLRDGLPLQARLRLVPGVGELRIDLALVLAESGRRAEALRAFAALLGDVARRGLLGVVTQAGSEVVELLELAVRRGVLPQPATAALDVLRGVEHVSPVPVPGTNEVLTGREMEVLRLVAGGGSNADLAAQLVVSVNTVKTHVSRIMTKLGARSRIEAVAKARGLRLL